jgi:transglutaminase-like putative cysteine protease
MKFAWDHRLLAIACALVLPAFAVGDERVFGARALWERSAARDLRLSADAAAVELDEGALLEDDGPAAGYSYRPNEERLSESIWIKKELMVASPVAKSATLLVAPGGKLKALINGQAMELKSPEKAGNYWQAYSIPVDVLKPGKNEIVLFGAGKIWIARAEDYAAGSTDRTEHPNRSAKSADAGKSWDDDRLGPAGDVDGEYYVRLFLNHFRSSGALTLPVLDAGNLAGREVAPPLAQPVPIRVHCDAEGGEVRVRIRTGSTAAPDAASWSPWQDLPPGGELRDPQGRFFQLAALLSTADPMSTPRLKSLRVEASPPQADDWSAKLKVRESRNAEIARSAAAFAYEPFDHPRLKELRLTHKLEEVVQGAKTELELVERLARWSASRWQSGHLKESYPPWDALAILQAHADGKPVGGFCQQFNLVFLQACESFGIPGRAVSISVGDHGGKVAGSGHEVVELWSNQFGKWIYVDGNFAWYAVDAQSGVPLSLLELRSRQLRVLTGKPEDSTRIVHLLEGGERWEGLEGWPAFLELRLIPRSNFLEAKSPLPLNQGMRGWFWTGHHVWTDADYPASVLYGNRVPSRSGWEWTLNQARCTLEALTTPGEMRVHLDTQTPGFETFLADIDGAGPQKVRSGFIWKLHAGTNRLEIWPRNIAGREGVASSVTLELP